MPRCVALIVAAGRGHRFGGEMPKQYRTLAGRPLLRYCAEAFARHPKIDAVRVIIHPDDRALYDAAVDGLDLLPPVHGGAERQDSARLGLESLAETKPDLVLIHDAARPFPDEALVTRTIDALAASAGAVASVPVNDTLKRAGMDNAVAATVDRAGLWRAQTPQGFRYAEILAAHRAAAGQALTDDAAVAERAGLSVALVMGNEDNFKVTTEDDLARAARKLGAGAETRVGMGFDVHRFGPGDKVWLCGIEVAHTHGLVGHSDADVGLHAITDAILGAIGAGDIGQHFPPSDPQWRGAASDIFLAHAAKLVREKGGAIQNVDITFICEQPKIGPHRPRMEARVAEILGVARERVSVKATTTERLGFTGRDEGMAAQAIASVRLPAAS
ncbi:MAG: bifunctional 2-C-methyl-D-erythritol 4-phosphate cytidylyltransferase/2-C-methyl-D-erythritol 2,4-cyclodiphosphate synthase [Alphaproteobacteria bacterium]|nr:bifunctional 2-C-methyl-D-erythritol 4-phosphate cytidylyltransferase/2-C-methyl-D-erythritol 2,4-cyclodiphosphate synthase [Alphaproteobacteria bacterium]